MTFHSTFHSSCCDFVMCAQVKSRALLKGVGEVFHYANQEGTHFQFTKASFTLAKK